MNILITSAGRRVSLIKSFQSEIISLKLSSKVFAADSHPEYSSACMVADSFFQVVRIDHPDYINNLLDICLTNGIKLVIPTIDTELILLSKNKSIFQERGITILIADEELVSSCRDKRKTHVLFKSIGINVAKEYEKSNPVFPLFIKPYDGSCSVDTFKIDNEGMLTDYHFSNDKLLFLEYIDKNEFSEFTIDLYYDRNAILKCVVPRERLEVRGGEVSKGITRKNFLISFLKKRLNIMKGAVGCITMQLFVSKNSNQVIGIEINPRFGGGYPLSYFAGANFTGWIIEEYLLDKKIEYFEEWEDNLLMLRYDNEILVHDFKG